MSICSCFSVFVVIEKKPLWDHFLSIGGINGSKKKVIKSLFNVAWPLCSGKLLWTEWYIRLTLCNKQNNTLRPTTKKSVDLIHAIIFHLPLTFDEKKNKDHSSIVFWLWPFLYSIMYNIALQDMRNVRKLSQTIPRYPQTAHQGETAEVHHS